MLRRQIGEYIGVVNVICHPPNISRMEQYAAETFDPGLPLSRNQTGGGGVLATPGKG